MTAEVERIIALPRRAGTQGAWPTLASDLTDVLRAPNGGQTLRFAQALALHDAGVYGGAFCPIGVGEGKTLITLLVAYVLSARRPLLLLPASLIEKTERDRKRYSQHWLVPNHVRFFSYEMLGRAQAATELDVYRPDLIICDEVHKLKNRRAAVTRRVSRYMHEHPETKFVALSGTIMRKSLLDFGHILRWCLKENAPVPKTEYELEEWAAALDETARGGDLARLEPGALFRFCHGGETPRILGLTIEDARRGFQRRLVETPGVVATDGDGERVDCSIYVRAIQYKVKPITEAHFRRLRSAWERPDGKPLERGNDVWRHARELAIGFHYEWFPPPPDPWMAARRAWSMYVRKVLSRSRTLDSPLTVVNAIDAGKLDDEGGVLAKWRKLKPTFTPKTIIVWHDDSVLQLCAEWMKKGGVVWTEHALFAERLSELTGAPYFGAKGFSKDGTYIEDSAEPAIIASIDANREGKNLQEKWSRALIVSPPDGWDVWEQTLGRFHRTGQKADQVEIDFLFGCTEHANAWRNALAGTYAVRDTVGGAGPKLLLADPDVPSDDDIEKMRGPRWTVIASNAYVEGEGRRATRGHGAEERSE